MYGKLIKCFNKQKCKKKTPLTNKIDDSQVHDKNENRNIRINIT